jgi:hypothetical protein
MKLAPFLLVLAACSPPDGTLTTTTTWTGDEMWLRVFGNHVPLHQLPIADWLALPMTGALDVDVDLAIPIAYGKRDFSRARGSITASCRGGCTLGDDIANLSLGYFDDVEFGHLAFDSLELGIDVAHGHAAVTHWRADSPDVDLFIAASVELAPRLDDSAISGCIRFRGTPALEQRDWKLAALVSLTGAPLGPDGLYHVKLDGNLGDIKRLGVVCN